MDNQKWAAYAKATDSHITQWDLHNMHIFSAQDLEYYWSIIQRQIIESAITTIDNHMTSVHDRQEKLPQVIIELKEDIAFINKLLHQLKPTKLVTDQNIQKIQDTWGVASQKIISIAATYDYQIQVPSFITTNTATDFYKDLKKLLNLLKLKYDLKYKSMQGRIIKDYIQQRCEDLKANKGHMIRSFMDKEPRMIIIDRLLEKDAQGVEHLITDPQEIKSLVNNHFQKVAGATNEEKIIPDRWREQYLPQESIDHNIYSHLMDEPTLEEWSEVICALPKNKAAGPSHITNEMLQHLGPEMNKVMWKFVKACIRLNDIPQQWKKANIYPIPKPKPWECDLNNTRPITLLETAHKAMIRLLNNRLAKIMVTHRILKGNQFAGLPGTSTFEPIRIVNEIIQDAREKKKKSGFYFKTFRRLMIGSIYIC